MMWNVTLNAKTYRVKLPDRLTESFQIWIDDNVFSARWDSALNKAFIVTELGEMALNLRNISLQRDPNDVEVSVAFEWRKPSGYLANSQAIVAPYSPLGNSSASKKESAQKFIIRSQMNGRIVSIAVREGESVKKGDVLCVIEAMKMENRILAPVSGRVSNVCIKIGDSVSPGTELIRFKDEEPNQN